MPTYNTPQYPIITAVFDVLADLPLKVYTTVPKSVEEYILISQPTLDESRVSAACVAWDATLLVTVFTKFKQADNVSISRALTHGDEVMGRLQGHTLHLDTFSSAPVRLQRLSMPQQSDGTAVYVQDVMRLRFRVFDSPTVIKPVGKSLNDYTPAEVLGYDKLDQLGPLNCPLPPKALNDYEPYELRYGYARMDEVLQTFCPMPDVNAFTARYIFDYFSDHEALRNLFDPTINSYEVQFVDGADDVQFYTLGQDGLGTRFTSFEISGGTAIVQIEGQVVTFKSWVGQAGQAMQVIRLDGNPLVKAVNNSAVEI